MNVIEVLVLSMGMFVTGFGIAVWLYRPAPAVPIDETELGDGRVSVNGMW